jgi:hypothetical protein
VALLERGFIPIPCRDGVAAFTFRGGTPPTEGAVRSWAGLYPNHSETGIWKAGHVILVTEVPPTEAELHDGQDGQDQPHGLLRQLCDAGRKPALAGQVLSA